MNDVGVSCRFTFITNALRVVVFQLFLFEKDDSSQLVKNIGVIHNAWFTMNNNPDNQIVLSPSSITSNILSPCLVAAPNYGHCTTEMLIDFGSGNPSTSIPPSTDQNAAAAHERQAHHQFILPSYSESNAFSRNGSAQTALLSSECDSYPNSGNHRYSPPPPYDLCQLPSHSIQSIPSSYPQQILHFPQHQNLLYLQQQRFHYPQQESLRRHEGMSDYPQSQRMSMPYTYRSEANFPVLPEPIERRCQIVDTVCCCFCVLPICILILWLIAASTE